jgi:hypothetical protein
MQKNKIIKLIIFVFLIVFLPDCFVLAEGASLYLSPGNGTFFMGSTFDVSIFVNTGGININTVKADLKFDPKKIQIASPATGKSFISVWISQPSYSNVEGTISFQGGTPSPGINTSAGLVSTITFRAISPGETDITILNSSKVLLDDGKGTDILSSIGKGSYQISIPPPEGPKIFSSTHPDQNKWYKNNNPSFSWDKEEGVIDFSYSIDQDFHGIPDNQPEGTSTNASFNDLEDGIWYFHVKAKKGNAWGGTSNYLTQIDKTPPAEFKIEFDPLLRGGVLESKQPMISFFTTDVLSGVDHFELKLINFSKNIGKEEAGFFIETVSPYKLSSMDQGEYEIIIRAYDKAMNYRDISERIEIVPEGKILYVKKNGLIILNIFISWKSALFLLIIIIILIISLIFILRKRNKKLLSRFEELKLLQEKIIKNNEKIENELHEK